MIIIIKMINKYIDHGHTVYMSQLQTRELLISGITFTVSGYLISDTYLQVQISLTFFAKCYGLLNALRKTRHSTFQPGN